MPGLPPYPVVMARAMTRDAAARGADVLVVAGDLTAAARPDEVTASLRRCSTASAPSPCPAA